jgi:hypothetical protein
VEAKESDAGELANEEYNSLVAENDEGVFVIVVAVELALNEFR